MSPPAEKPHLSVQQVEVVHGLLHPALTSDLWAAALRTDELLHALLSDSRRKEGNEAGLAQEAGAVGHCDDLQTDGSMKRMLHSDWLRKLLSDWLRPLGGLSLC